MAETPPGAPSPEELARQVQKLDAHYRFLLDLRSVPYAERLRKQSDHEGTFGDDILSRVYRCPIKVRIDGSRHYVQVHPDAWRELLHRT